MKLKVLHVIARVLGIQFKVGGLPYGATVAAHHQDRDGSLSQAAQP